MILISSELPEVIGLSDRVIVIRGRRIVGEVAAKDAAEEKLLGMASIHLYWLIIQGYRETKRCTTKTEKYFPPVPIVPHGPCNRKAPARSNEQVLIKPLFFQDHGTLGGDGGLNELGGILGGEEQLLAALHILHGA